MSRTKAILDRTVDRIDFQDDGCWVWTGPRGHNGYGTVSVDGVAMRAHRALYQRLVEPVSKDLDLDHLCRVRECVNPDHLEPVSRRKNLLRGVGFAAVNAAKTHCKYGHEFTPENTYWERGTSRICKKCKCNRNRKYREQKLSPALESYGAQLSSRKDRHRDQR